MTSKVEVWKKDLDKARKQYDTLGKKIHPQSIAYAILSRYDEIPENDKKLLNELERLQKRINDLERKIGQYWGE